MGFWLKCLAASRSILPLWRRTRAQVVRAQTRALKRLLAHAYRNVAYYREAFDRAGVRPEDVRTPADLVKLPVTTKDDLRGAPLEHTLARGVNADRLVTVKTSGSVGEPFTIRFTGLENRLLMLSWTRPLLCYGRRLRDRLAILIYPRPEVIQRCSRQEQLRNAFGIPPMLIVDMCQPLGQTLAELRRYGPDFLGGYPGVLLRLAEMADHRDRSAIRPRVIWVGGEVLTETMRRGISRTFGCRVYDCYASEEFRLIAWECRETGELHVLDENVIVEVLKDGRPAEPGETGEVVATGLHSYAMPFIRYRLGDVATMGSTPCACGLPCSTIREVQGRTIDYFTLPRGRLLHPYEIIRAMHQTADWIWGHQLVQERTDRVVLHAVPRGSPPQGAVGRLERAVKEILGPGVEFSVALVGTLEPGAGGKLRYARSLLAP